MKKKLFTWGILGVALVFAIAITSCDNDEEDKGNTDQKTLVITNISEEMLAQSPNGSRICLFPVGTPLAEVFSMTGVVALGGAEAGATLSSSAPYTYSTDFYDYSDIQSLAKWTASGVYDVYLMLRSDDDYYYYYLKQNVSFASTPTFIDATTLSFGSYPRQ
jgi:hypothetical protein